MKSRLLVLLVSLLISSCCCIDNCPLPVTVSDARKLFVVHIHGDWCKTCANIDSVIHDTETYWKERANVKYLVFDETNPKKLAASATLAKKFGLEDHFEHERHTGELLYIDRDSKQILTKFYGVNSQEKYQETTEALLQGKKVESILAKRRAYKLSKPSAEEIKKAKLLVIDIHHDMCGGCAVTAPIFEDVAKSYKRDKKVCFMTFDLTNRETVQATRKLAQELGLEEIYNSQKHTGEVLFVNAKTKEILDKLVLERDKKVYKSLIKKLKRDLLHS